MIYLILFLIIGFGIFVAVTQSGNKNMQMFADKSCPKNQKWYPELLMCGDIVSDQSEWCPKGKILVNRKCICSPLSSHPDCLPAPNKIETPPKCPINQKWRPDLLMCVDSAPSAVELCPVGKILVNNKCVCIPLSSHPDCLPKPTPAPAPAPVPKLPKYVQKNRNQMFHPYMIGKQFL